MRGNKVRLLKWGCCWSEGSKGTWGDIYCLFWIRLPSQWREYCIIYNTNQHHASRNALCWHTEGSSSLQIRLVILFAIQWGTLAWLLQYSTIGCPWKWSEKSNQNRTGFQAQFKVLVSLTVIPLSDAGVCTFSNVHLLINIFCKVIWQAFVSSLVGPERARGTDSSAM